MKKSKYVLGVGGDYGLCKPTSSNPLSDKDDKQYDNNTNIRKT